MSGTNQADTDEYPVVGGAVGPAGGIVQADIGSLTHTGLVRTNNEDNFHIARFGRFLQTVASSLPAARTPEEFEQSGYGICVADGMGGQPAGEVASRRAIGLLVELVLQTPDWLFAREALHLEAVMARFARRFGRVNAAVIAEGQADPRQRWMGTTLSVAVSLADDLIVAHVGDSPAFLFRGGRLARLTRDHTSVLTQPPIKPGAAARLRTVLTRAIGIPDTGGTPDLLRLKLLDGDRLLLCTDGLTDMVDEGAIAEELGRASVADVCAALVGRALERGGRDNVTVVVAAYRFPGTPPAAGPGG